MIDLVSASNLDTDKWDACIRRDGHAIIYGCSWYLDTLGADWDALVYGDYQAVMPLVHREKWGQEYLFRPVGVQQLGLFGDDSDSPELMWEFLNAIPERYRLVDLFTNAHNRPEGLSKPWQKSALRNYVLSMDQSYQELYKNFSHGIKWNIKQAQKYKHRIFEYDSPEVLIHLFRNNQGKRHRVTEEYYQVMRQLMYSLLHKKRGVLWTVHDERNSPLAGAFFAEFEGRVVLLFVASDDSARETQAVTHLLNEFLVYRSGHLDVFDFEGGHSEGMGRFYGGFGSREANYFHLRRNTLPIPFRWLKSRIDQ